MKEKLLLLSLSILFTGQVIAQHKLLKLWETTDNIAMPESVLKDPFSGLLYVSIMGTSSDAKDGIGGIGILGANGNSVNLEWVTGLHAPKGMAIYNNKMYVADVTDLVVIDMPKAKVEKRIPVAGAVFLNDVTVNDKGLVYVSDSRTKRIHVLQNNSIRVYMENIDGLNGLKAIGEYLFIAGGGKSLLRADAKKNMIKVAGLPQGGDGIEPIGNGDFLYSSWPGYIYYVHANGESQLLLDTHLEKINTADIGYDPLKRIVYVPTFFKNSVIAYQLQSL